MPSAKRLLTNCSVLLMLVFMAGCVTSYRDSYSDFPLGENIWRINAGGNAFTSQDRVEKIALVRAAEISLELGYNYFVILDGDTSSQHSVLYFGGGTPYTRTSGRINSYGNTATYNATTTYHSNAPTPLPITKYNSDLVVSLLEDTQRGYLGIGIEPITRETLKYLGINKAKGVFVAEVLSGGPAEKAGIQPNDIITGFNGVKVEKPLYLSCFIASAPVNKTATAQILRNGHTSEIQVMPKRLEDFGYNQRGEPLGKNEPLESNRGKEIRRINACGIIMRYGPTVGFSPRY